MKSTNDVPISHLSAQKRLWWAFGLGILNLFILLGGSLMSGSLTLLADSAHMLGHSLALGIAIAASVLAQRLTKDCYSDGYQRVETLGGYTNGLLLILVGVGLAYEAIGRFYIGYHPDHIHHSHEVDAGLMGGVAIIALLLHALSAYILYGGRKESLNIYALYLHLFFDVAATLTGLITSILIHITNKDILDSLASLMIAGLIIFSAIKMVRKSLRLLAGMVPETLNIDKIKTHILDIPHITDVHDILVQPTGAGNYALSAHIVVSKDCADTKHWQECRERVEDRLEKAFGIQKTVLQIETP